MSNWDDLTPGERYALLRRLCGKHGWPFPFGGGKSLAGLAVDHIDGDATNNDSGNLRIVDTSEDVRSDEQ